MSFGFKIKRNAADSYFSDLVRIKAGWKCEVCRKDYSDNHKGLENSHFIGRGNKSTRWDFENCAALCFYCHKKFTENPNEHYEFFRNRLGQIKLEKLIFRSHLTLKELGIEESMIRFGLRMELKKLKKLEKENILGSR